MEEGDSRGQDQAGVADSFSPFRMPMSARFRTSGGLRRAQHWCTCPARGISLRANRCAQPRRNALDAATNLDVTVRIVGIDDRKGHSNAFFQVARFDPSLRGVHPNKTILVITPDRRHLRRSIGHDGSQIRKRLLPLQQVEILFGNDRHGTDLFAEDSATRAKTHPANFATFITAIWGGPKLGPRSARPAE